MIEKVLAVLIVMAAIFVFVSFLIMATKVEVGSKETKCYDRHNNEIEGLVCLEETTMEEKIVLAGFGIVLSVALFGTAVNIWGFGDPF